MSLVNQRHHLVLLFTDLTDSTRITADMEPEHYAELLTRLRDLTSRIVSHHGGEVVRIDGDGALCIFGYPLAHEDSGRRATEAALDLHAAAAELDGQFGPGLRLRLHSGIHAGVVLLRSGDMVRGRYEMLGDATNVAARLCDASSPDGLLVSAETLGGDAVFFTTGEPRALELGGRSKGVRALPVLGRSAVPSRFAGRAQQRLTPLTGREGVEARLAQWLDGSGPDGTALLLHGPAGIGKSRLLAHVCAQARAAGWWVGRGYCEAYLAAQPLQPFLQIAGELAGSDLSEAAMASGAVGAEIARAAQDVPILVVIDDWQWADDASRDQLAALLSAAPAGRLRVLLGSRQDDARLPEAVPCARQELLPLSEEAAQAAIAALLGTVEPGVVDRLVLAAGGSPLLLEELCHAWSARGEAPEGEARGAWFDMAVQARFAALAPGDAALLRQAAVIGHLVPSWLLAAIKGEAIRGATLDRLAEADFLYPGETGTMLRFKHGLTREAVYAGIGLAERRELHARTLAVLEERAAALGDIGVIDALAYHSAATGLADKALDYGLRAGDAALAAGALDRAQAHYRAALDRIESLPPGPERESRSWSLLNKFGMASIVDPADEQLGILQRLQALLTDSPDPAARVRGHYWLGAICYGLGRGRQSISHLLTARETALHEGNERFVDQIEVKLAQSLSVASHYADADTLFRQVLPRIWDRPGKGSRETLIYAVSCFGFMLGDQGHMAEADDLFDRAGSLDPEAITNMRPSLLTQRAAVRLWQGEWEQAEALASAALRECQRTHTRYLAMMSHAIAAYARWRGEGGLREVARLEDCARWFLLPGNSRQRSSLAFGWLADAMAARGDLASARGFAGAMVQRIREGGDRLGEGMTWRALARLEQDRGKTARAEHYLRLAERSAELRRSPREAAQNKLCAARLALIRGDSDLAARHAAEAESAFAALGIEAFGRIARSLVPNR